MATTKPLTDAITALTTYANGVTGASDTTLSDAVRTLADGYGGGGGGGDGLQKIKEVTISEDTRSVSIDLTEFADKTELLITMSFTLSASDWVYLHFDTTTPSTTGKQYTQPSQIFDEYPIYMRSSGFDFIASASGMERSTAQPRTNLLCHTYDANKRILSGSTYTIYGK